MRFIIALFKFKSNRIVSYRIMRSEMNGSTSTSFATLSVDVKAIRCNTEITENKTRIKQQIKTNEMKEREREKMEITNELTFYI